MKRYSVIRGPYAIEQSIQERVYSISDQEIRQCFIENFVQVYNSVQHPQYDVIIMGHPREGWIYNYEGQDKYRPDINKPFFKFSWFNPKINPELEIIARIFTPKDSNFTVNIAAKPGRCENHNFLHENFVKICREKNIDPFG